MNQENGLAERCFEDIRAAAAAEDDNSTAGRKPETSHSASILATFQKNGYLVGMGDIALPPYARPFEMITMTMAEAISGDEVRVPAASLFSNSSPSDSFAVAPTSFSSSLSSFSGYREGSQPSPEANVSTLWPSVPSLPEPSLSFPTPSSTASSSLPASLQPPDPSPFVSAESCTAAPTGSVPPHSFHVGASNQRSSKSHQRKIVPARKKK